MIITTHSSRPSNTVADPGEGGGGCAGGAHPTSDPQKDVEKGGPWLQTVSQRPFSLRVVLI